MAEVACPLFSPGFGLTMALLVVFALALLLLVPIVASDFIAVCAGVAVSAAGFVGENVFRVNLYCLAVRF